MTLATDFVSKYGEHYVENGEVMKFLERNCMFTFQTTVGPVFILFYVLSDKSTIIISINKQEQSVDTSLGEDVYIIMNDKYKELAFSEMFGTVN